MTQSIPVSKLPNEPRRDQWGRYLVVPPGETKPVGYTRVTTVAKTLESGGALAPWKAAMTAGGIIMRKGLRAQWEALYAEHGDPWYAGETAKAECKRLVEESADAGGANDRKQMGSALHVITAIADITKNDPPHLTDETAAELKAYRTGMALSGIDIDYDNVELTVVLDEWRVAGTFDRLAIVPGFELPLIADLKTGADLSYSWNSIAVQLSAYAHGDDIYVQGPNKDGSKDQRVPMPAVDQRHALVMWLPAGDAKLEFFIVDIEAGWAAFDASMWCREWRNRKDLATPLSEFNVDLPGSDETDLEKQLQASLDALKTEGSQNAVRVWLQSRIDTIGHHSDAAKTMLRDHWPKDLPTLQSYDAHTTDQLVTIEQLLDGVERALDLGFPVAKPTSNLTIVT